MSEIDLAGVPTFSTVADAVAEIEKCPRNDGDHWWYWDADNDVTDEGEPSKMGYVLCECKSCPVRIYVDVMAEDCPEY